MLEHPRSIYTVIDQLKAVVPPGEDALIGRLDKVASDAVYRAPEAVYLSWELLGEALHYDMAAIPTEDWHFEVYSIFSTRSIEDIKAEIASWVKDEHK